MKKYLFFILPLFFFYFIIIFYPLFSFLSLSFTYDEETDRPGNFTLEYYNTIIEKYIPAFTFTAIVSTITTIISCCIGYLLALSFFFGRFKFKQTLSTILKIPLFVPTLVVGFMFLELLVPVGYVNGILQLLKITKGPLQLVNDPNGIGIIIATTWCLVPIMFIFINQALASIDPELEMAARNLGASKASVLRHIYFPLSFPALLAGSTYTFIWVFGSFAIPITLGASWPKFITILIYDNISLLGRWGLGSAIAFMFIVVSFAFVYLYHYFMRKTLKR